MGGEERRGEEVQRERETREFFFDEGTGKGKKTTSKQLFCSIDDIFSLFLTVKACVATERRASRWRSGEDAEGKARAPSNAFVVAVVAIDWIVALDGQEGNAETAALRAARREPRVHLVAAEVARAGIVVLLIPCLFQ